MRQTSRPLPQDVPLCAPGHRPQIVETNGAPVGHAIGEPCPAMFHIECQRCGIATEPHPNFALAEARWTDQHAHKRVPISLLPRAREQAYAALREGAR